MDCANHKAAACVGPEQRITRALLMKAFFTRMRTAQAASLLASPAPLSTLLGIEGQLFNLASIRHRSTELIAANEEQATDAAA